ncbi:MAG: septum formation inhibitor Maf [Desulfobulbaceae bacterium]|nr:septum formation inhibitor Maf [Desulfobulbaceae bacterium]
MTDPKLHLASQSPRRQDILRSLGLSFTAGGVDVDERRLGDELPEAMVLRLSRSKAMAANVDPSRIVVGADTLVVLGDVVFGKPKGRDECLAMLAGLSGRTHRVLTGVAVMASGEVQTALSITEVKFREISSDEALAYWHSGEPCDKAGAYAIQGRGGIFVEAICGSYSGVVGLPVYETSQLLCGAGLRVLTE